MAPPTTRTRGRACRAGRAIRWTRSSRRCCSATIARAQLVSPGSGRRARAERRASKTRCWTLSLRERGPARRPAARAPGRLRPDLRRPGRSGLVPRPASASSLRAGRAAAHVAARLCCPPEQVFVWGLGSMRPARRSKAGLGEMYAEALVKAEQAAADVRATSPLGGRLPDAAGVSTRCLFKMDWAQAAYMIEQRTQPQGHFSYRRIAWGMYQALRERHPTARRADPRRRSRRAHRPAAAVTALAGCASST